ncbi:sensor histidine kinase [uncultured Friedmanniella sp.]|uniref:sensor histidine kinase n=1 Tax=uncultured Friedmanniella sp. TaxID=335381 RepID=UPI0035CA98D2
MGATQPVQPDPPATSRIGPFFAAIWLFFLLEPFLAGWALRTEARGVAAMAATVAFGAVYLSLWMHGRQLRHRLVKNPPVVLAAGYVAALVVLGSLVVALLGEAGMTCAVYVGVACVMVFPLRLAGPIVLVLTVGVAVSGTLEPWGSQVGNAFSVLAGSFAIVGLRAVMSRNIDLLRAQQVNASLAVENERSRFARDLHDILGHSLTVITVKAELAQRLLDVDPERARAEVADLERLSRDALADVRHAVEGYRELTLPGEIARARTVLDTVGVQAQVPGSADEVPTELRELFAWTIREGVTNVVRHAGARSCSVLLTPTSVEIRDDGRGSPPGPVRGSGLAGLRERAAAAGAIVVTRSLEPGFSLRVVRP